MIDGADLNTEKMALATPTTVTAGMNNYESYYKSAKDGKIHGYIISIPKDYDPATAAKYPLLVYLHGAGEQPGSSSYNISKLKSIGVPLEIFGRKRSFPAIIVAIQTAQTDWEHNPVVIKDFIDILTGVSPLPNQSGGAVGLEAYKIDVNRIHLSGVSMGGYGVYNTASTFPDFFASISVFAGFPGSQAATSKIKIPTYIRHNTGDYVVTVNNAYNAQKWINAANPAEPVNFSTGSSTKHDCWSAEYSKTDDNNVFNWHWRRSRTGIIPPTPLTIMSLAPVTNSFISTSADQTLTLMFNNDIRKSAGTFTIKNVTSNRSRVVDISSATITVSGNKAIFSDLRLSENCIYSFEVSKGAFTDLSGVNACPGVLGESTWKLNVGTVASAPLPLQITSFTPATNGIVKATTAGTLTLVFSEDVKKGSGTILTKNLTAGRSNAIDVSSSTITVSGNKVTIYPVKLYDNSAYAFQISQGAFTDLDGKPFSGIADDTTWTFRVSL